MRQEWKNMTDHELIHRMDRQDEMLTEIRDKINAHLIESDNMRPALEELVSLWKGSKLIIPIMSGLAALIWAVVTWGRDHLK
jgi:hypothetical protein